MKNINIQKSRSLGYTLIELLAVISILVVISGIITGILYSTLRGSKKTSATIEMAQNGAYALSIISNSVIDSEDVLKVKTSVGTEVTDCTKSPSGPEISLRRFDGATTTFKCELLNGVFTVSSNSGALNVSLINTQELKVDSDYCSFSCTQKVGDPYSIPIVGISFKITDKNTGLLESAVSSTFETSVSLRNYSP